MFYRETINGGKEKTENIFLQECSHCVRKHISSIGTMIEWIQPQLANMLVYSA